MKKLFTILFSVGFALSVVAAPIIINIGGKIISISPPSDLPVLYNIPTNAIITVTIPGVTNYQVNYYFLFTNLVNSIITNVEVLNSTNLVAATNIYSGGTLPAGVLTAGPTNLAGHLLAVSNGFRYNTDNAGSLTNLQGSNVVGVINSSLTLAPRLGFVATGTRVNNANNSAQLMMSRSYHVATTSITNVELAFDAFYATTETGMGTNSYITATVEYPSNTFNRVTFNGQAFGIISNASFIISDFITINPPIPEGAMFWVRTYMTNSGIGVPLWDPVNSNYQELSLGSGVTDQTGGGTIPQQSSYGYTPLAIIGMTTKPSILMFGDSRGQGFNDVSFPSIINSDLNPSQGQSRIIDIQHYGSANMCLAGDAWNTFYLYQTNLMYFTNFATAVYAQFGINNLSGQSYPWLETNIQQFATNVCRTLPVYGATIEPDTTSSDNFMTITGQTYVLSNESYRKQYNNELRSDLITGLRGYLDTAACIESSSNSGYWAVDGQSNYLTYDGLHCSQQGYKLQAASIADFFNGGRVNTPNQGAYISGYTLGSGISFSSLPITPLTNTQTGVTLSGSFSGNISGTGTNINFLYSPIFSNGVNAVAMYINAGSDNANVQMGTRGSYWWNFQANDLLFLNYAALGADQYPVADIAYQPRNPNGGALASAGIGNSGVVFYISTNGNIGNFGNFYLNGQLMNTNAMPYILSTNAYTIINTNWIIGGKYSFTYPVLVNANAALTVAAVSGEADLDLEIAGNVTNHIGISTIITSIAMTYTNSITGYIPANAVFDFTNRSSGSGNSATVSGGQYIIQ